ncbi:MAG: alpha/beta hydrolase [Oscillatoriophycideae cyanobacterium NC_groundwater_1537_Pr4_S-0.65um_50_18]|nr:alpha/beta hydrolase [Oscillatoriophycideae cyanobacterium NC_groundwater_1537_Pr4_S-0.65um_50_18]
MLNAVFTGSTLQKSTLRVWITGLLLGAIASFLFFLGSADAAETIILNYRDIRTSVPNQDFTAFVNNTDVPENVQAYFQQIPLTLEESRNLLTKPLIPKIRLTLDSHLNQFLALQLNKLMGEPYGRESLDSLESVVVSALADDRSFSILELINEYPESVVKVYLGRLSQVHRDVDLFIGRIQPLLRQSDGLLEDLVCECEIETPGPALMTAQESAQGSAQGSANALLTSAKSAPCDRKDLSAETAGLMQVQFDRKPDSAMAMQPGTQFAAIETLAEPQRLKTAELVAQTSSGYTPPRVAQEVVITFGPLARSISIGDLTTLAETGSSSRSLRSLLSLAKVSPDSFRSILSQQIKVKAAFLDKTLNNVLGEFALFEMGQVVGTGFGQANIPAMRSTLILSAQGDEHISLIEFLQNYPLQQVYLDGAKLASLTSLVKRSGGVQNLVINEAQGLENFLVGVQAAIAEQICNCGGES